MTKYRVAAFLCCMFVAVAAEEEDPPPPPMVSARDTVTLNGGFFEGAEYSGGGGGPGVGTGEGDVKLPKAITDCPENLVLFVHGFENSEEDAEESTAALAGGLASAGYTGTVVGYSWDSDPGLLNFDAARDSADLNGKTFAKVIKEIKNVCPTTKINVITHSLGARVALVALECGACACSVQLVAPAVDNSALTTGCGWGGEFGSDPLSNATDFKVWINPSDSALGNYYAEEGDGALGKTGIDIGGTPDGYQECKYRRKMGKKKTAHAATTLFGNTKLMKCLAKSLIAQLTESEGN